MVSPIEVAVVSLEGLEDSEDLVSILGMVLVTVEAVSLREL